MMATAGVKMLGVGLDVATTVRPLRVKISHSLGEAS
jgi:hypothetical protein